MQRLGRRKPQRHYLLPTRTRKAAAPSTSTLRCPQLMHCVQARSLSTRYIRSRRWRQPVGRPSARLQTRGNSDVGWAKNHIFFGLFCVDFIGLARPCLTLFDQIVSGSNWSTYIANNIAKEWAKNYICIVERVFTSQQGCAVIVVVGLRNSALSSKTS